MGLAPAPFWADELLRRADRRGAMGQSTQMTEQISPCCVLRCWSWRVAVVELSLRTVEPVLTCGITLGQQGRVFTAAMADELVSRLDELSRGP